MVSILFVLFLEERIPVEADHAVCDPASAKPVAYAFGDEQNDLWNGVS